ncbi:MAG: hypothetical protein EBU97_06335 [Rhodobacteraceae bacterium]|nr:hypothetical protein [Paracoccaceae bacterium]
MAPAAVSGASTPRRVRGFATISNRAEFLSLFIESLRVADTRAIACRGLGRQLTPRAGRALGPMGV